MTSKERVRAVMMQQPTDRVPASFEAVGSVSKKLMKHYGFDNYDQLIEKFDVDVIVGNPVFCGRELKVYKDEKGNTVRENFWGSMVTEYATGEDVYHIESWYPLKLSMSTEELLNFKFPNPDDFDYTSIKKLCDKYPDKAIRIGHPGSFQIMTHIMEMSDLFILMVEEPDVAKKLFKNLYDFEYEYYTRIFEAGEGKVDILRVCDDYGTQISTLFSVDTWREFFKENTKKLADLAHKYSAFYQQHSCGAIGEFIPEFIECGVDALDPVQKVRGLEVEKLKELYSGKITFQGGIDVQDLLPNGTPEQVATETRKFIEMLGKNNSYILMSSQAFETDIPIENIEAVYSVSRKI